MCGRPSLSFNLKVKGFSVKSDLCICMKRVGSRVMRPSFSPVERRLSRAARIDSASSVQGEQFSVSRVILHPSIEELKVTFARRQVLDVEVGRLR